MSAPERTAKERELAAEAIGYVVAWGLILAVGMAACSAMLGPSSPVSAPSATVSAEAPSDTPAPTARRSVAPGRRTPAPSFDLNLVTIDCDPNDPQMDPIDEECPAP